MRHAHHVTFDLVRSHKPLHLVFQFVFLDAPFESLPGPGVGSFFNSLKPFFRWHCDQRAVDTFDIDADEVECERETVRRALLMRLKCMTAEREKLLVSGRSVLSGQNRLSLPSVHIRGIRDPWRPDGKRLMETYYTMDHAEVVSFQGAHQVPTTQTDVDQIRAAVLRAWTLAQQGLK